MKRPKYKNVLPIKSFKSTSWLVEMEDGRKYVCIWHKKAKIEHIVDFIKLRYQKFKFTVSAIEVGMYDINIVDHAMTNGRKLNQNKRVVIPGDDKYDFSKTERTIIKKKNIKYDDIPY